MVTQGTQSRARVTRSVLTGSQDTWPGIRQQTLAASWEALGAQRADGSLEERSTPAPQASGQAQPEVPRAHSPLLLCGPLSNARPLPLELSTPSRLMTSPLAEVCHPTLPTPEPFPLIPSAFLSKPTCAVSHQPLLFKATAYYLFIIHGIWS